MAGLITRTVHPVVPPRVDYALTELGRTPLPVIEALRGWGEMYRKKRASRDWKNIVVNSH